MENKTVSLTKQQIETLIDALEYAIDDKEYEARYLPPEDESDALSCAENWRAVLNFLYAL